MELGAVVSLLLSIVVFSLVLIVPWRWMCKRGKMPPGPTPLPLVGNLLQIKSGQIVKSLLKMRDTYGSVFTVYLGHRRTVVLCGYKAIKEALIDQGDNFAPRGALPSWETMLRGVGVGVANGVRWFQNRRFSIQILRDFGMGKRSLENHIQEEAQYLMKALRNTNASPCDPTNLLVRAPGNIIFSIILGSRFDYEDEKFNKLLHAVTEAFHIMSSFWGQLYDLFPKVMDYLPGTHQKMIKNFRYLEDYLREVVKKHQESLDVNCPRDYIDCYLLRMEQEKQTPSSVFEFMNLLANGVNLLVAGIETLTLTLRYGLLMLSKYPDIQEKVQREIDEVIGENRSPVFDDRNKMPFTNAVVHEIQRFSDIIPMGATHAVKRDTPFMEYVIQKDTNIMLMLTTALHDPEKFCDPFNFNPQNFLDENGRFMKNDAFMPFSAGKRICLGEGLARTELFLYFIIILKNFTLKSTKDPKDIDLTPVASGFENLPPPYEICFIPR